MKCSVGSSEGLPGLGADDVLTQEGVTSHRESRGVTDEEELRTWSRLSLMPHHLS